MTDFGSVYQGFTVMLICLVAGPLLVFSGGYIIDSVLGSVEDMGLYDDIPSDSSWLNFSLRDHMINIYYIVSGVLIPFFGVAVFYLTITRRHRWDYQQNIYDAEEY